MNKTAALLLLCTALFAQQKGTFTDTRYGKIYKTVKIGEQVWMAENLNYEAEGSRCYKNSTAYCKKYGRLYNWETSMKACPNDWHLPSNVEWDILTKVVGGEKTASKYLKAVSGWNDRKNGESGNGTDNFGFSALPGGSGKAGSFYDVGNSGHWWSSSESVKNYVDGWNMGYHSEYINWRSYGKDFLWSVRCLQDR